jgi:SET domain-containing protein
MMDKQQLFDNLSKTYCRIKPSRVHGVGVFAIRDIPAHVNPFEETVHKIWHRFEVAELKHLDPEVLRIIDDFLVIEEDGTVEIPAVGLNNLNISYYMNNAAAPNVEAVLSEQFLFFRTLHSIGKGEELTIAYETFDDKYKKLP